MCIITQIALGPNNFVYYPIPVYNLYPICDQFLNCTSYTIWLYGIESMLNQISYQSYAIQLSLNETLFDK